MLHFLRDLDNQEKSNLFSLCNTILHVLELKLMKILEFLMTYKNHV